MTPQYELVQAMTRRQLFGRAGTSVGVAALASLLGQESRAAPTVGRPGLPHFAPTAKRIIYLFQSGGAAQMDLFD